MKTRADPDRLRHLLWSVVLTVLVGCTSDTQRKEQTSTASSPSPPRSEHSSAEQKSAFPPRRKYNHSFKITSHYARIDDYTSVDLDDMPLGNGLKLTAFFLYPGRVVNAPKTVSLHFTSSSENWKYLQYHRFLRVILDGSTRVDLGEAQDHTDVGTGYVFEQMTFDVPVAQFLSIIAAQNVEGELGLTEFRLKPSQLEALRDFGSRMVAAPASAR